MNLGEPRPAAAPRHAFVLVVVTLVGLHACMAATRVAASLSVLAQGYPAWVVGALLSVVLLNQQITPSLLLGSAFITAGVLLALRK